MLKKFNEKIAVVECLSGFKLSRMEKFNLFIIFIFNLQILQEVFYMSYLDLYKEETAEYC